MSFLPADSVNGLPFPGATASACSEKLSDAECEVINLFDNFRDSLLRYVLSFGLTLHDGEEITQEVFLALFRHLQLGKSRKNLRGWIFRVAHNLALKQRHANQIEYNASSSDSTVVDRQVDPSPGPEELASFTQTWRLLQAALHALPEKDQCCLRLRAEGLRYREIAAVLDMSVGAVSISLTRSLARLNRANRR